VGREQRGHFAVAGADLDPDVRGRRSGAEAEDRGGDALAPAGIGEEVLSQALRAHDGGQCSKIGGANWGSVSDKERDRDLNADYRRPVRL
jgi:hypothetical protein